MTATAVTPEQQLRDVERELERVDAPHEALLHLVTRAHALDSEAALMALGELDPSLYRVAAIERGIAAFDSLRVVLGRLR